MQRLSNRTIGGVFGAVYVVVGIVGFAVTGGVHFAAQHGKNLVIFGVNPLHNVVHVLVGVLLVAGAAKGAGAARAVNTLVGVVYGVVGVVGLFVLNSELNILALNHPDNVLHFLSAALLLVCGLSLDKRATTARAPEHVTV